MSTAGQKALKEELVAACLRSLTAEQVNLIEAAVACMGAAAVVLGCLPPEAREAAAVELDGKLLEHANKRAAEIRSGEFDRLSGGH